MSRLRLALVASCQVPPRLSGDHSGAAADVRLPTWFDPARAGTPAAARRLVRPARTPTMIRAATAPRVPARLRPTTYISPCAPRADSQAEEFTQYGSLGDQGCRKLVVQAEECLPAALRSSAAAWAGDAVHHARVASLSTRTSSKSVRRWRSGQRCTSPGVRAGRQESEQGRSPKNSPEGGRKERQGRNARARPRQGRVLGSSYWFLAAYAVDALPQPPCDRYKATSDLAIGHPGQRFLT